MRSHNGYKILVGSRITDQDVKHGALSPGAPSWPHLYIHLCSARPDPSLHIGAEQAGAQERVGSGHRARRGAPRESEYTGESKGMHQQPFRTTCRGSLASAGILLVILGAAFPHA